MKKLRIPPFYYELFRLGAFTVLFIFLSYLSILLWNPTNQDGRLFPLNTVPGLSYDMVLTCYFATVVGLIVALEQSVKSLLNLKAIGDQMVKEVRSAPE